MKALRTQVLVAFDATAVAGAVVSQGLGGRRLRSFASAPLPPGSLDTRSSLSAARALCVRPRSVEPV